MVCLEGGYWGAKGARIAKNNGANALVIDKDPDCTAREVADTIITELDMERLDIEGVAFYVGDAVKALLRILKITTPAWIIPTIHGDWGGQLTEIWLATKPVELIRSGKLVDHALQGLSPRLVLSADQRSGTLISSYMPKGMRCALDCSDKPYRSVSKKCPVSGRRKIGPMYELVEFSVSEAVEHYKIFVAKQLGGIGAIPGKEVKEALEYIYRLEPPYSLAIGASCRCHGRVNFFEVRLPSP